MAVVLVIVQTGGLQTKSAMSARPRFSSSNTSTVRPLFPALVW